MINMAVNQTRDAFFNQLACEMEQDEEIVIVSVDLAGPPFDIIRKKFPSRYIPVGIAEQNAIATACGLALTGKKTIVYAANPFPLLRALDQIRNGVCMMSLPVQIVGLGTGFSVAECGSTHFTLEDVAIASLCQGLEIYSVSDEKMAIELAQNIRRQSNPAYYRFGKWATGELSPKPIDYAAGYRKIRGNGEMAVVSTGCTVKWLNEMELPQDVELYDWFKLSYADAIVEALSRKTKVVVVEEMLLRAGIGSILLEELNESKSCVSLARIGIGAEQGYPQRYGTREYWLKRYDICRERILAELK